MVNWPQVRSVHAGGVSPVGLLGFESEYGPPVKVRVELAGDSVPLGGVVAANARVELIANRERTKSLPKLRMFTLSPLVDPGTQNGSTTTADRRVC